MNDILMKLSKRSAVDEYRFRIENEVTVILLVTVTPAHAGVSFLVARGLDDVGQKSHERFRYSAFAKTEMTMAVKSCR